MDEVVGNRHEIPLALTEALLFRMLTFMLASGEVESTPCHAISSCPVTDAWYTPKNPTKSEIDSIRVYRFTVNHTHTIYIYVCTHISNISTHTDTHMISHYGVLGINGVD